MPSPPQPENYYLLDKKLRRKIYQPKMNDGSSDYPQSILDMLIALYKLEKEPNFQPNIKSILISLSN